MSTTQVLIGHALDVLKGLPSGSVDCCVTSPPYWALRDYKTEPVTFPDGWVGQLGLEPTPQMFVGHLVAIFDEVKRVLKDGGTCWVIIGDTYSANRPYQVANSIAPKTERFSGQPKARDYGLPEKCLVQIPSRFALAMSDAGWTLRNEIIWHKPNVMPSSAMDRFTVDFEKLFFFTKGKRYFFEPQYEPYLGKDESKAWRCTKRDKVDGPVDRKGSSQWEQDGALWKKNEKGRNKRTVWTVPTKSYKGAHFAVYPPELVETPIKAGCPVGGVVLDPFGGSGTTAMVANKLGREAIIIELNEAYKPLIQERVGSAQGATA